jgi:hypothetical protein
VRCASDTGIVAPGRGRDQRHGSADSQRVQDGPGARQVS